MRDIIVVGAGGGGAVVAKELGARGLDVLLLEAGPRFAEPETDWSHFESDANNPFSGYFRFGPADRSKPGWVRDVPANGLFVQLAGVGGTTNHYQGNSPRAMPGAFLDHRDHDGNEYDTAHLFPFSYRELMPYYEWVEETLPVETAPMGRKEEIFFEGARRIGLPLETSKDITRASFRPQENAILQPRGTAGRTGDPSRLLFPQAQGCTFCGHCSQGCFEPQRLADQPEGQAIDLGQLRADGAHRDLWCRHGQAVTLIADAFAVRIEVDGSVARGLTWRIGSSGVMCTEEARVIVLSAGPSRRRASGSTAACPIPTAGSAGG